MTPHQAQVDDRPSEWVSGEEGGHLEGITAVGFHADGQRLQAAIHQVAVKGREDTAPAAFCTKASRSAKLGEEEEFFTASVPMITSEWPLRYLLAEFTC